MPNPRKPTHLKIIQGTNQPCRANPKEPKPQRAKLAPPKHLTPGAKSAWIEFAGILDGMGVLSTCDSASLEALSTCYADFKQARDDLTARGSLTYETKTISGETKFVAYPECGLVSDLEKRLRGLLSDFGLTPASRSRVSVIGPMADANPFAALG